MVGVTRMINFCRRALTGGQGALSLIGVKQGQREQQRAARRHVTD